MGKKGLGTVVPKGEQAEKGWHSRVSSMVMPSGMGDRGEILVVVCKGFKPFCGVFRLCFD